MFAVRHLKNHNSLSGNFDRLDAGMSFRIATVAIFNGLLAHGSVKNLDIQALVRWKYYGK